MGEKNNAKKITFGTYAVIVTIVFLVLLVGILAGMLIQKNKEELNKPMTGMPYIEEKAEPKNETTDNEGDIVEKIIGDWSPYSAEEDGEEISLKEVYGSSISMGGYLTFKKDGTYTEFIGVYSSEIEDELQGNYTISDNKINMTSASGTKKVMKYDEKTGYITTEKDDDIIVTFKKVTKTEEDKNTEEKDNKEYSYFVLYNGYKVNMDMGIQPLEDIEIGKENKKKYNTTYYNYENGKYLGKTKGDLSLGTYEDYAIVDNVKRIAISEKYDAIPRKVENIDWPKEITMNYKGVDVQSIDLDGDGKQEYVVCGYSTHNGSNYSVESEIALFNSDYQKVATLVHWDYVDDGTIILEEDNDHLKLENVEYIDIDNDGNMEILIYIPQYESSSVSILKYENNKIKGKTDYEINLNP